MRKSGESVLIEDLGKVVQMVRRHQEVDFLVTIRGRQFRRSMPQAIKYAFLIQRLENVDQNLIHLSPMTRPRVCRSKNPL